MKKIIKCITVFAVTIGMIFSTNIITHAVNTNLALNKTATASDVESGTNFTANLAVDGISSTRWASNPDHGATKSAKWLKIDFGVATTFDMVDVSWEQQNIQNFQLQISNDDNEWEIIYQRSTTPNSKLDSVTLEAAATARYLRVYVTNYNGDWPSVSIFELGVYNSQEVPIEPANNYQIYPIPQKVTDYDSAIDLTKEINVVKEEGIDEVTKARIDEVLTNHQLIPTYSQKRAEDKTNLYIGINGSNGSADQYRDVPKEVFVEGENKYDMHVVKVFEEGDIVILGKDSDAAFYGLATLEQMLDQSQDNKLRVSVFEDYAFQKYRGAVEGYYGYPWSVDGTLSWFDYAKRYKMNIFLYGPKSDPYHLGKWDEDYPLEVSDEDSKNGVRTKDEMEQYARKATACKVDFVWVAHPAMQKPIDFTDETTIAEGIDRLMTKFDHMYQLGVRQFGIFVDDISESEAARTCDMQIYMLNKVQEKLYEKYNQENNSVENKVKPLFFTPAWYTTGSSGAAANLPKFKNVHQDIEICFTGNNVFSSISNSSATTFKNWIGRTPVMWWNYPVNDAEDSVFFTNPINKAGYTQDPNPTNIKGVLSNPMNFSEASKVSFFGLADYTWNPQKFDAQENWEHSFDAIIPDDQDMAKALKVAYGNLNDDYVPIEVQKVIASYSSSDRTSQIKLKDKMFEIMNAISKIETLKNSDNSVYRLIVEEAQTSFNKLYDMAEVIGGAMAVISSDDPVEQMQGFYMANAANERLSIPRNKRYQIISLEGAGEDIYNSVLQATASDAGLKPFVNTAINAISDFDPTGLDTSAVNINTIKIEPNENVVVKQGDTCEFTAHVVANFENINEVNWLVEGATGQETVISKNGILTVDKNELSPVITVKAISAYDSSKIASVSVAITDREYIDPTIPVNLGLSATILGASGNAAKGEGPENVFDDYDTTKWCPGNSTNYNQWLAFDLGSVKQISKWQLVGGGIENKLYIPSAYSLQVLKDPNPSESDLKNASYLGNNANWQIVAEYTNNKENVTNYKFDPNIEGRYFRLFVANASQPGAPYPATRIFETRIYGVDKEVVARTHKLSIDESIANGKIITDAKNYEEGAKVNISILPDDGYQLIEGTLKYNDTLINGTSFIMPNSDVIITAQFEKISTGETYTIQVGTLEHGTITVNKETAKEGDTISLNITPDSGYALKEGTLKYNDVLIKGNSFIMPNTNVVITAQFEKISDTANKIALSIAIEMAEKVTDKDLVNVVPVVVNEFKVALQNAQNVYDNANATQEEVNNAFDRLAKVMQMLEFYKGDKAALQKMMDQIANLKAEDYTKATWKALQAVLPNVNEVLGNENAMQDEVDEVYTALVKAFVNLRLKPNKDLLNDLINQANRINRANFTAASLKVVDGELSKAHNVLNDPEATREAVDNAVNGLTRALAGLVENKPVVGNNVETPNIVKPGDRTANAIKTGDTVGLFSTLSLLTIAGAMTYISRKKRND